MAINFCLYYSSQEKCEYLKKVITSSRQGVLVEAKPLVEIPPRVNSGAHVIFLEYPKDHYPELDQWIRKTAADPRNPPIFLYFQEITTDRLWKALRLGVKECFVFPIRPEEFQEALDRLPVFPADLGLAEPTRLISVLGSKGGVGTTFLTVNTAYLWAREEQGPVLLVDLDLRYGQMIYFFDVKPQYTLVEVIENVEHLDRSYLQSLFYQYDKHLQLLPAPVRLEDSELVTPEELEHVLQSLKKLRLFRAILVDAGHQLDEITLKSLEVSDDLVLVTTPTIPALSNAKKLLELLQLLGVGSPNLHIWLNSWQKRGDFSESDVSGFLGREVTGTVPFEATEVNRSINEGIPLAKTAPGHAICRDLKVLADKVMGVLEAEGKGKRRGLFGLLRR
jgi:pilus assembly protein CpaE